MAPVFPSAPSPYEALRTEITALVGAGCGIAQIELELTASELSGELSEEHAAALWLLAWSLRDLPVKPSSPPQREEPAERPRLDHRLPRPLHAIPLR